MIKRVDQLEPGDLVDLIADTIADPDAVPGGALSETAIANGWEFEYEVVLEVERETPECYVVYFESGNSFAFDPGHVVFTG